MTNAIENAQRTPGGERGAAALPIIVGVAVAIALVQVPIVYKTKAGNKFSGAQKTTISAKSLAEAGIDQVITDIGRKAIRVSASTDTVPYSGQTMGRGSFTTSVKAYHINPDRVEVTSTGSVGGAAQTVRARMELVKTETTIPYDTPRLSAWGIRGTPPTLYYHSLEERAAGRAWIFPEGEVRAAGVALTHVDDFCVAANGTMYFINNVPGLNSVLFKIRPTDLDKNPSTPVEARLVGPTGLIAGDSSEIRGLTFISRTTTGKNGVLYAVTWKNKKVYELSLQTGAASFVANIVPRGVSPSTTFWIDAMTQDLAGTIYFVQNNGRSYLWRFDEFVEAPGARQDTATRIVEISGMKDKTRALAGHPNGYLYAMDDERWYRINPFVNSNQVTSLFLDNSNLKGMGFFFEREDLKFTGAPIRHKVNICHYPPGNCANSHTIQIDENALNSHLNHGGSACAQDKPGYCDSETSTTAALADTTIQLRIISWKEISGSPQTQSAGVTP